MISKAIKETKSRTTNRTIKIANSKSGLFLKL